MPNCWKFNYFSQINIFVMSLWLWWCISNEIDKRLKGTDKIDILSRQWDISYRIQWRHFENGSWLFNIWINCYGCCCCYCCYQSLALPILRSCWLPSKYSFIQVKWTCERTSYRWHHLAPVIANLDLFKQSLLLEN